MESQGISFINYQLRAGIAASLSLFPIPFSPPSAVSASPPPCQAGGQPHSSRQVGHMAAETAGRRSCELFLRPPSSPSSKNPICGALCLAISSPSSCCAPKPPISLGGSGQTPHRVRPAPQCPLKIPHSIPSWQARPRRRGPPCCRRAGGWPQGKEAALGSHVFLQAAQRWVRRLWMSTFPAMCRTSHHPAPHFIPPGAAPTRVCWPVAVPCPMRCIAAWCMPIAGRAGVGEGRQGRATELGEPSACCLWRALAQPVTVSGAHSPCLHWTGRCCWRRTDPLLTLFVLRRVHLLSLVQKCQQAESKWLLMGGRRGGEGMAVPAPKAEEPRDSSRAKRKPQVDPVTKKRSRL